MKVALITHEFPPLLAGGAGKYMVELYKALTLRGHDVSVFGPLGVTYREVDIDSYPLVTAPAPGLSLVSWARMPWAFAKATGMTGKFDVVHAGGVAGTTLPRFMMDAPYVVTIYHAAGRVARSHPTMLGRLKQIRGEEGITPLLERREVQRADIISVPSNYTASDVATLYPGSGGRVRVAYPSFVGDVGLPSAQSPLAEETFPETDRERFFLAIGRSERRKGTGLLLEALSKVEAGWKARLVLVGADSSSGIRGTAKRLGLEAQVSMLGKVTSAQLRSLMKSCAGFVSPSSVEGFGYAVLEAMSVGCTVIATRGSASEELIEDRVNGLLCDASAQGLADAMQLVMSDERIAAEMGSRAQLYVREKFTRNQFAASIERAYVEATDMYRSRP